MNIEIANRLVNLRKNNHLSQEALAEKLGISRQAVSKWERAEASPDTDNLILLSKLYHVSLDELLKTEEDPEEDEGREPGMLPLEEEEGQEEKKEYVDIGLKGVHVKDKDGSEVRIGWDGIHVNDRKKGENVDIDKEGVFINGEKWEGWKNSWIWSFPLPAVICVVYLLIGFMFDAWHPGWLLFLLIPIWYSFVSAVKNGNAAMFAYPVLVTLVYLCAGFWLGIWHPAWMLYLTVPVYYYLASHLGSA